MSDTITALLRTVVPVWWGSALAWLVARGLLPTDAALDAAPLGLQLADLVVAPLVIGTYYAAVRWLESRAWVPRWVVRVLLGSAKPPTYTAG
jgi:hypothetical protein